MNSTRVRELIQSEQDRHSRIENLIASENYPSEDVMEALGSIFASKYAEGYPGKRYYGGCDPSDELESYAVGLACNLFDASYANVQPHSGSQANHAVYKAIMKPGSPAMALGLDHGGHLSHGSRMGLSGEIYNFYHYGVTEYGNIDYKSLESMAEKIHPALIVAGGSSLFAEIDWERMKWIAGKSDAILMADMAHAAGFIAAREMENPLKWADIMTMTTQKTLRGPRGGLILSHRKYGKFLDAGLFPGIQGGPHMHSIAAKAVALEEAGTPEFRLYVQSIKRNVKTLVKSLAESGVPEEHILHGSGAPHMLVLNTLNTYGLSGIEAQEALERENIVVNKQMVPGDKLPPSQASGIRIGMPAWTTMYMRNNHGIDKMDQHVSEIAGKIHKVLNDLFKSNL